MTDAEYTAIFDDMGLATDALGQIARQATLKCNAQIEEFKKQGISIECAIGFYFDGYYQALKDQNIKLHQFMGFDISRIQKSPHEVRLVSTPPVSAR